MPIKFNPKKELKPYGNVNVKTKSSFLNEASSLWGNKTLAATKAFESYLQIRDFAVKHLLLFTLPEIGVMISAFPESPSTLIQYLPVREQVLKSLESQEHTEYYQSCRGKIEALSELELAYLLLEIERINTVRKYCDSDYLSFRELINIKP